MTACSDHLFLHCFYLVLDFQLLTTGASEPIYRVGIETQTWKTDVYMRDGKARAGMNWAKVALTYINCHVCRTDSWWEAAGQCSSLAGHSEMARGAGWGRLEAPEGRDACLHIADSFYCVAETNRTL